MRICLAGDIHGNKNHAKNVFSEACHKNADLIIQVGDYGYGWHLTQFKGTGGKVECDFTHFISDLVKETGIPFMWLDGNHENFDHLYETLPDFTPQEDGTFEMAPGVFYIPRGTRLEFGGVKFLVCGGAVSVDKRMRVPYVSWWAQEALTQEDVDKCARAGKVDVLLTHDFPWEGTIVDRHLDSYWGEQAGYDTAHNRKLVSEILKNSGAKLQVHGHLHIEYDEMICNHSVHLKGLNCDGTPMRESTVIYDTETHELSS